MSFIVDLTDSIDLNDIIYRVRKVFNIFSFVSEGEYKERIGGTFHSSWDALEDDLNNLDFESGVIRKASSTPTDVHLVVKNIEVVKAVSQKDYEILCEILEDAKDPENRGDDIRFTYEIIS